MILAKLTRFCGYGPHESHVLARREEIASVVAADEKETDKPSERTAHLPGVLAIICDEYALVGLFIQPWSCDELPGTWYTLSRFRFPPTGVLGGVEHNTHNDPDALQKLFIFIVH